MSYLALRKHTYHYRRRIPEDVQFVLGQKFWKQSLATGSYREAEIRARALGAEHDRLIKKIRALPHVTKLQYRRGMLEQRQVDALLRTANAEKAERWDATRTHRAAAVAAQTARVEVEKQLEVALAATTEDAPKLLGELQELEVQRRSEPIVLAALKGEPPPSSEDDLFYKMLRQQFATLSASQLRRRLAEVEDQAALRPNRERRLREELEPLVSAGFNVDLRDDPNNPHLNTATELWFAARKQGETAIKRHRVAVRRFVELCGNIRVRDVTRQMVKDYVERITNLADHRRLPAAQRGGLLDVKELPRVSAKTVERHLVSIKALLAFCTHQDWISTNPATGLSAPRDTRRKATKRRAFTREERLQVLSHAAEEFGQDGDMTWLIRLGAYTGCRLEELAQLSRANVKSADGVWVIEIDDDDGRNVKSESSIRMVPLHPAIRDSFVQWVKGGRGDRVFNSFKAEHGRYANRLSGDFARLMDRAGLPDPRLVFHSFRHGLKKEMSNARVDIEARKAILGHAPTDAHGEYEGHSLKALAKELARVHPLF